MRAVFFMLILIHGLIHFMGFAKALDLGNMEQLTKDIPKPLGILWLLTGLLFVISAVLYFIKKDFWPILSIVAVVLSQLLIIMFWKDSKFGTIANIIILIIGIVAWANTSFENQYHEDVFLAMRSAPKVKELITEKDLEHLPTPVQNYLSYVGIVGKPKVFNFRITFEGQMRDKGKDWFSFTSEQYNFVEDPTRLFFMKAKVSGLPTAGYHRYATDGASMLIKLLSLFSVAKMDGPEMFPTETVTFFNDMCLFAPAALVDERIQWEELDAFSARAVFTNNGCRISAVLYFNEKGRLVNFVSEDRIAVSEMKTFPFSTPVGNYKEINGHILPTYGEAIWHYPDGEFVYGKFNLMTITYNVEKQ
ncbi:DUF6544 family protein [Flagellimonas meishanensis]|uniref:DUF6544 family protein n=1 Tax=Flagellimonas meishanensis TaxID=2873264 RepID=UPI001CA6A3E4|nr:DUF6544 family protein [[Muricauda] meishanensis]